MENFKNSILHYSDKELDDKVLFKIVSLKSKKIDPIECVKEQCWCHVDILRRLYIFIPFNSKDVIQITDTKIEKKYIIHTGFYYKK